MRLHCDRDRRRPNLRSVSTTRVRTWRSILSTSIFSQRSALLNSAPDTSPQGFLASSWICVHDSKPVRTPPRTGGDRHGVRPRLRASSRRTSNRFLNLHSAAWLFRRERQDIATPTSLRHYFTRLVTGFEISMRPRCSRAAWLPSVYPRRFAPIPVIACFSLSAVHINVRPRSRSIDST